MVLLSIFFTQSDHGGIISRLFFIHFVAHALALHLAVKILLQIFLYEDLSVIASHICRLYFPQIPAGPHFVTPSIHNEIENIPNI